MKTTKAGPAPLKKYSFLAAGVGCQWDVDLAQIYHDQMVHKGKHHNQAVCACATHLGDRILAILKEDRPYQRRDEAGNPITASEAKAIIEARYSVPEEVCKQRTRRARKERRERQEGKKKRGKPPKEQEAG